MTTPATEYHFPRERGALTGDVLPPGMPCPMDDEAQALRRYIRQHRNLIWVNLPDALPAFVGHSRTAYPRGPFDLPVARDCEADGAQHWREAA